MILAGLALMAASTAAASLNLADEAALEFRTLCADGPLTPAAVFARAKAQGWRASGTDAPKRFDLATERLAPAGGPPLILTAASETSAGERRDTCGVGIRVPTQGLLASVQRWLGFSPAVSLGLSATFFALRGSRGWSQADMLDRRRFDRAKAEGRFYSIMVLDRGREEADEGAPASIVLLRLQPVANRRSPK